MTDPTALPNVPPPAAPGNAVRDRVVEALRTDGLIAEVDQDGDVAYKVDGQQLFVRVVEGDVTILRVFGQWQIGEDVPSDELAQLRACNELAVRLSVVKAALAGGTLLVTAEQVLLPGTDAHPFLPMLTQAVLAGVQGWHQIVTGQVPGAVVSYENDGQQGQDTQA